MREATIPESDLEAWAEVLLQRSLEGIEPQDRVMIKGERIAWPLMEILERRVIQAGALPDVYLVPPNNDRGRIWSAAMVRHGRPEQLERIPAWNRERYESATKFVEVMGAEDPARFQRLTAEQTIRLMRIDEPYALLRCSRPWVITLYPTPAAAEAEGLDLAEYARLVVKASVADLDAARRVAEPLLALFQNTRQMTLVTRAPQEDRDLELRMDLTLSRFELCTGQTNVPDGELSTSPDARSVEGEVFLDRTGLYNEGPIGGVYLRLEGGRVVEHRAAVGQQRLDAILETDEGARRIGEVALGLNGSMRRPLMDPLFLEKLGGTLHMALGDSYPESFVSDPDSTEGRRRIAELTRLGALNRSAQHVDLVADFRPGGCGKRVLLDGSVLAVREGAWRHVTDP